MLQRFRFFIIIVIFIFIFLPGFAKLQELRQRLLKTESDIAQTQRQSAALQERLASLKTNQDYLEIVAREKMGVVKKGETVLKIVREEPELKNAGPIN